MRKSQRKTITDEMEGSLLLLQCITAVEMIVEREKCVNIEKLSLSLTRGSLYIIYRKIENLQMEKLW